MAGELVPFYLLGLPFVGALAVWVVIGRGWRAAMDRLPKPVVAHLRGKAIVFAVLPATLLLFGFSLWTLYVIFPEEPLPLPIIEAGALAYGLPALLTGIGEALATRRGMAAIFEDPRRFGKAILGPVLVEATALLAFSISFLVLSSAKGWPPGDDIGPLVNAANLATLSMSLGSLGAPASGAIFAATWRTDTGASWARTVVLSALPAYGSVAGFAAAYLVLPLA